MGYSQANKAENRARILKEAAAMIREDGLAGVTIARLMERVGLTVGGFYKHFASRDELLAIVLEQALEDGHKAATAFGGSDADFDRIVRAYLSRAHRDQPGAGCAIAALGSDVARADEGLRAVMSAHIESFISGIGDKIADDDAATATTVVCAMIGALMVSRILSPPRSDQVLRRVRDQLIDTFGA